MLDEHSHSKLREEPIYVGAAPLDVMQARGMRRVLACRFLLWDAYVGGRARVGLAPIVLARSLHEKPVRAAESAVRAVHEVTESCFSDERETELYGLPRDA